MLSGPRRRHIENEAIRLRHEIWEELPRLRPGPRHPLDVLEPQFAAAVLDYELQYVPDLRLPFDERAVETAGLLDRNRQRIVVADCFGRQVRRFTTAHELGHVVLNHNDKEHILHRDLPIVGLEQKPANDVEREANYFAGCYLMPAKFLKKVFTSMFGVAPLTFDYNAAAWLNPSDPGVLLYADHGSLTRYRAVASARSYAGRAFETGSLAEFFKVSVATMAIRLRELDLIDHAIDR